MKAKELGMLIGLGLLMSPLACSADLNTIRRDDVWLHEIKELPLYEIGPRPIPLRDVDLYIQNFVGVAHHVFVEHTPHSLTLGARMRW